MKVFIIDDEEVSIFIIRQMLILEGVASKEDITAFTAAEEALNALLDCSTTELPDVVLLDLAMPTMDGWQFLEALAPFKDRFADRCSIYILTSSILPTDAARAHEIPLLSGFFQKPMNPDDIQRLPLGAGARVQK